MVKKASLIISSIGTAALLASSMLVGCGSTDSRFTGEKSNSNVETLTSTGMNVAIGAVNSMCNDALKLTVTGIQRRPVSTFSGSKIDGASTSAASEASTDDVVIEVDISFTWNVNTYSAALAANGSNTNSLPSTLGDLLVMGETMYVQGEDADGKEYISTDVITPSAEKDTNMLAINSQWDYNILNSPLPEASKTQNGSILLRVASTASNLKLYMRTPMSGQQIKDMKSGKVSVFSLDLT